MPDTSIVTAAKTVAVGLVTGSAALLGQWLAQRSTSRQAHEARLALVTNADVATQPLRLRRKFNDAVWNEVDPSVDIWEYMDDAVDPFMAAARRDLDN